MARRHNSDAVNDEMTGHDVSRRIDGLQVGRADSDNPPRETLRRGKPDAGKPRSLESWTMPRRLFAHSSSAASRSGKRASEACVDFRQRVSLPLNQHAVSAQCHRQS